MKDLGCSASQLKIRGEDLKNSIECSSATPEKEKFNYMAKSRSIGYKYALNVEFVDTQGGTIKTLCCQDNKKTSFAVHSFPPRMPVMISKKTSRVILGF
jgi:hypothetical protein